MSPYARRRSAHRPTLRIIVLISLMVSIFVCAVGTFYQPRSTTAAVRTAMNPLLGIDLPIGAALEQLPPGITDYIRRTQPGAYARAPCYQSSTRDRPPGWGGASRPSCRCAGVCTRQDSASNPLIELIVALCSAFHSCFDNL